MVYDPHRQADGVNRADRGLRTFGRRVGDAIMCVACDGAGYVPGRFEPVKCSDCGGEGLDSEAMREMER